MIVIKRRKVRKRKHKKKHSFIKFLFLICISLLTVNIIKNYIFSQNSEWTLILVNQKNKLPFNYSVSLMELSNGKLIDERIYPDLQQMFDDMRSQGLNPVITSAYRDRNLQKDLLKEEINMNKSLGYSQEEATTLAESLVARPGFSEHETGLALDINLDSGSNNEDIYYWLANNSYKYGFIIRYPEGKTYITGIQHEPWHIRYVGTEAAEIIFNESLCLEEYLDIY